MPFAVHESGQLHFSPFAAQQSLEQTTRGAAMAEIGSDEQLKPGIFYLGFSAFALGVPGVNCLRWSLSTIPSYSIEPPTNAILVCHRGVANPLMDCAWRRKWRRVFSITGHTY
jgi:hypothetical protein